MNGQSLQWPGHISLRSRRLAPAALGRAQVPAPNPFLFLSDENFFAYLLDAGSSSQPERFRLRGA
jgi:hypothetical protein